MSAEQKSIANIHELLTEALEAIRSEETQQLVTKTLHTIEHILLLAISLMKLLK